MTAHIQNRIATSYDGLSDQLKRAADFVLENPVDVASRSMRSLARRTSISPATFSRLSRELGFEDYDQLREACRAAMTHSESESFFERAVRLQQMSETAPSDGASFFARQMQASVSNMETLTQQVDGRILDQIVETLIGAERVIVSGQMSSAPFAEYMYYLACWASSNWQLANQSQASAGIALENLGAGDVFLLITKSPYATRSIAELQRAKSKGARVILLTDSHKCPALSSADLFVIVPTGSPQFFSSYIATTLIIETIIGMLVMRGGEAARKRIASVEATNRQIGEYWFG